MLQQQPEPRGIKQRLILSIADEPYLAGHDSGFGAGIGWGKRRNGRLKNHYPKSIRQHIYLNKRLVPAVCLNILLANHVAQMFPIGGWLPIASFAPLSSRP